MRTTLDIDDDVLAVAKTLAKAERKTAGQILSELARKGIAQAADVDVSGLKVEDGWLVLPEREGRAVTNELIDCLIDDEDMESVRLSQGRE